jgi:hypothetical protein
VPAAPDAVGDEGIRALEQLCGLIEIDDVDAIARAIDVGAHPRVPALGLVTKVHTGVDEGPQADGQIARRNVGTSQSCWVGRFLDFKGRFGHRSFLLSVELPSPQTNNSRRSTGTSDRAGGCE